MVSGAPVQKIAISPRAAKKLLAGHPWVYRSDLSKATQGMSPRAELVHITDERGRFIASAFSSSSSQIALRMISHLPLNADSVLELLSQRISAAASFRKKYVHDSQAYRVVFSEADFLPGLIVDRYGQVFTLQFLTQAMDRADVRQVIVAALLHEFGEDVHLVDRTDPRVRKLEELPPAEVALLHGFITQTTFRMNGLTIHFDALSGQKSGAFLDQRQNYLAAAAYGHGHALDVFCYQGGFALHLARVCESVTAVDSSRAALEVAEANALANCSQFISPSIEWTEADAFELMKDFSSGGKRFDTIVLDPPAFAKSARMVPQAVRGYKELNVRALKMLRPGGILITNSCSHHLSESAFLEVLAAAASDTKREVRIFEKRTQSLDHPLIATIPETFYLKCLICQVS